MDEAQEPDLSILVVSGHDLWKQALGQMIRERGIAVEGEVDSGSSARQLLETIRPDVVVMDRQLPDIDALELTREIVQDQTATRVIVLGPAARGQEMPEDVERLFEAGASAYVARDAHPDDLFSAIRMTAPAEELVFLGAEPTRTGELSERELEVLRRMGIAVAPRSSIVARVRSWLQRFMQKFR